MNIYGCVMSEDVVKFADGSTKRFVRAINERHNKVAFFADCCKWDHERLAAWLKEPSTSAVRQVDVSGWREHECRNADTP